MIPSIRHTHALRLLIWSSFCLSRELSPVQGPVKRRQELQEMAERLKISLKESVVVDTDGFSNSRILNKNQQAELGLYIPKWDSKRMTIELSKTYCDTISSSLYALQKQYLPTFVQILQTSPLFTKILNLDNFVNLIYKDIYARYLLSRGIGVSWPGYYSSVGLLNHQPKQLNEQVLLRRGKKVVMDFINIAHNNLKFETAIGLYSNFEHEHVSANEVEFQKVKKVGFYWKKELTDFGKHVGSFEVLNEKQAKVYLLIFTENLEKMINPQAICVKQDDLMIILKQVKQAQSQTDAFEQVSEYLITTHHVFNRHKQFFEKHHFSKHSTFQAKELLQMKAANLFIIPEIADYHRESSLYLVNASTNLPDFQRLSHCDFQMNLLTNLTDDEGFYLIFKDRSVRATIPEAVLNQKLEAHLKSQGVEILKIHDIFDDHIYFHKKTKEIIKFRLASKLVLHVNPAHFPQIKENFKKEGTIISESKIKLEPLDLEKKKPREKRKLRKAQNEKLQQKTSHVSLEEALQEIETINISTMTRSQIQLPFLMQGGKIVGYSNILEEKEMEELVERDNESWLTERRKKKLKDRHVEVKCLSLNSQLIESLLYLDSISDHKGNSTAKVVIEPQSETDNKLALAIHLNHIIQQLQSIRKPFQHHTQNLFKMIKLHPTIIEDQRHQSALPLIQGQSKLNSFHQYPLNFQSLRGWVAANDSNWGDREVSEQQLNSAGNNFKGIRTIYENFMRLMPNASNVIQFGSCEREKMSLLSRFMHDHIDCFIMNMERFYRNLELHRAYKLTQEFYNIVVNQYFVIPVCQRIIAFPNSPQNLQHFHIFHRLIELLAVITPLCPFTAYHLSKVQCMEWPKIVNQHAPAQVQNYNRLLALRAFIKQKNRINGFKHTLMFIRNLNLNTGFSHKDLESFFEMHQITSERPTLKQKRYSIKQIKGLEIISSDGYAEVYEFSDVCFRCDSSIKTIDHLCKGCVDYLENHTESSHKLIYYEANQEKRSSPLKHSINKRPKWIEQFSK